MSKPRDKTQPTKAHVKRLADNEYPGNGTLLCRICDTPYRDHRIGPCDRMPTQAMFRYGKRGAGATTQKFDVGDADRDSDGLAGVGAGSYQFRVGDLVERMDGEGDS